MHFCMRVLHDKWKAQQSAEWVGVVPVLVSKVAHGGDKSEAPTLGLRVPPDFHRGYTR